MGRDGIVPVSHDVDQRIPFEIVAFDDATYKRLVEDWPKDEHAGKGSRRIPKALRRTA